jgi:glycosyltransferase involved in cell wall biosynthesis
MLAPEPFFEPRGTPFSEYHRIKALGELGHRVDLVTYPFGQDIKLPNLRIFRCLRPPFVRRVAIGPSMTKAILDVLLAMTAIRRVLSERYDAIHSHEEAGVVGVWLARWLGIPHLYDMHSSLPQQLTNFRYTGSPWLRRLFQWAEHRMIDGSRVVITVCKELQDTVTDVGAGSRAILIENVMGGDVDGLPAEPGDVRETWSIGAQQPLALYTGTFEPYQGLELLTAAAAALARTHPEARVMVVGGEPAQVEEAQRKADESGARMVFTGQQPPSEIPRFSAASDILVSPRIAGTNTPLKIYSYLRTGKPIVATNLLTHTQVLDEHTALLVPPDPNAFAAAIGYLIDHPSERGRLAAAAQALAAAKYGRTAYLEKTREAYARLLNHGHRSGVGPAGP